jgi:hypothetical protein
MRNWREGWAFSSPASRLGISFTRSLCACVDIPVSAVGEQETVRVFQTQSDELGSVVWDCVSEKEQVYTLCACLTCAFVQAGITRLQPVPQRAVDSGGKDCA